MGYVYVGKGGLVEAERVSMSLEKNFLRVNLWFSVCVLSAVLVSGWYFRGCSPVFSGALQHSLWCASAWFVVRFEYVDRPCL